MRVLISLLLLALLQSAAATTIEVRYLDDPEEGAFDETLIAPSPGNPGTTLGEQRRNAHEYAISLIERAVWIDNRLLLHSDVRFENGRGSDGAFDRTPDLLGVHDDDGYMMITPLQYAALYPDRAAEYPYRLNMGIAYDADREFDYTLSELTNLSAPRSFVRDTLHEFIHDLGFVSNVRRYPYTPTLFDRHVRQAGANPDRPEDMTPEQRRALLGAGDDVRFVGPATSEAAGRILAYGHDQGEVFLDGGGTGSISHLSRDTTPRQLLMLDSSYGYRDPYSYTEPDNYLNLGIAAYMLSDMGWGPVIDSRVTASSSGQNKVQVEVSTDAAAEQEQLLVNLQLPEGISVADTTASPATCEITGQITACRYTRLSGSGMIEYTLTGEPGIYEVTADVDHQALHVDENPVNNFATARVQVGDNTIQGVTLDPAEVAGMLPAGTSVGRLRVTGPAGIDHSFALARGGEHNACFRIEGDQVLTRTELDYGALSELDIRIETTADNGFRREDDLEVRVTDVASSQQQPDFTCPPHELIVFDEGVVGPSWDLGFGSESSGVISWLIVDDPDRGAVLEITKTGDDRSHAFYIKANNPVDVSRFKGGTLEFDVRIISGDPVLWISTGCFNFCLGTVSRHYRNIPGVGGDWVTFSFNVNDLVDSDALHTVEAGLVVLVDAYDNAVFQIDRVRWVTNPDYDRGPVIDSSITASSPGQDRVRVEVSTDVAVEQLLVNLHFPEGLSVTDTTASPATCETTGQTTACRYARLSGSAAIQYTLTGEPGIYEVTADVDHQTLHVDPTPLNNSITTRVQVGTNTIEDVTLEPAEIAEAQPAGTLVGSLKATGPAGIDHTFALAWRGGEHNACFRIEGDQVLTRTELDYEVLSRLNIRIETRASNGFRREDDLEIRVTDDAIADPEPPPDFTCPPVAVRAQTLGVTASTTTRAGYEVNFRYYTLAEWDLQQPRGVYVDLHGNSPASHDVLQDYLSSTDAYMLEQGYVVVRLEAPWVSDRGSRIWSDPSRNIRDTGVDMLDALLSTGFGGAFSVDPNGVVLEGGSAGTCFGNSFIQKYHDKYQGGFYANCGCTGLPNDGSIAPLVDRESWRMYVQSTTGDFLFESGRAIYGYYKYTLGFETRGDFEKEGGHCAASSTDGRHALDWILSGSADNRQQVEPHFRPVGNFEDLKAVTIDDNQNIWVADQIDPQTLAIYKGENLGGTWTIAKELRLSPRQIVRDLLYFKGNLYLDLSDGALQRLGTSSLRQSSIQLPVPAASVNSYYYRKSLSTDHGDTLYYRSVNPDIRSGSADDAAWFSTNGGITWQEVSADDPGALVHVPELLKSQAAALRGSPGDYGSLAFDGRDAWALLRIHNDSGVTLRLYQSTDLGMNWQDRTPPGLNPPELNQNGSTAWFHSIMPTLIKYLADGSLLITGGTHSWISIDRGESWSRTYGSSIDYSTGLENLMSADSPDGVHTVVGFPLDGVHTDGVYYLVKPLEKAVQTGG